MKYKINILKCDKTKINKKVRYFQQEFHFQWLSFLHLCQCWIQIANFFLTLSPHFLKNNKGFVIGLSKHSESWKWNTITVFFFFFSYQQYAPVYCNCWILYKLANPCALWNQSSFKTCFKLFLEVGNNQKPNLQLFALQSR